MDCEKVIIITAAKETTMQIASRKLIASLAKQYAKMAAQNGAVFIKVCCTVIGTRVFPKFYTRLITHPTAIRQKKILRLPASTLKESSLLQPITGIVRIVRNRLMTNMKSTTEIFSIFTIIFVNWTKMTMKIAYKFMQTIALKVFVL